MDRTWGDNLLLGNSISRSFMIMDCANKAQNANFVRLMNPDVTEAGFYVFESEPNPKLFEELCASRYDIIKRRRYNSMLFDEVPSIYEVPSTKSSSLVDEVPSTKSSSLVDEVPSTKSSSLVDEPRFSPLPTVPYAPTSTTRLLNPLLLNPNSYNLFFLKMFNTRWVGEYTTYKF